jgi:dienelactone hydrolase
MLSSDKLVQNGRLKFAPLAASLVVSISSQIAFAVDSPAIQTIPAAPLMDEEIRIQVAGLVPGQVVILKAKTEWHGQTWEAWASFKADESGRVNVGDSAPVSGTYSGNDAMGLFWSTRPAGKMTRKNPHHAAPITEPRVTRIQVELEDRPGPQVEVKRWIMRPGVRVRDVKASGIIGRLYEPDRPGRHAAVLVLSGSDGGMDHMEAALLASHGYTALALAYFAAPGLPRELVEIPLEYFRNAIDWLKAQNSVDGTRLGITGASKGAEAALLVAATFPEFKAVVARAPSHVIWEGIGKKKSGSWSLGGRSLAFAPLREFPQKTLNGNGPRRLVDSYQSSLDDREAVAKAVIPVERIRGGVLLISGREDQMWPSAMMAEAVMTRLKQHHFAYPYFHLCYEGAGHNIPMMCIPATTTVTGGRWAVGGDARANAKAQQDARPKMLRFLTDALESTQ